MHTLQHIFNKASRRKGFIAAETMLSCMPHFNKQIRERGGKREREKKKKKSFTHKFLVLNQNCHGACYSSLITNDNLLPDF